MTKAWLYQIRKLAKLRASGFFVVIRLVPVNMLGQGSLRLVKSVGLDFLGKNLNRMPPCLMRSQVHREQPVRDKAKRYFV